MKKFVQTKSNKTYWNNPLLFEKNYEGRVIYVYWLCGG